MAVTTVTPVVGALVLAGKSLTVASQSVKPDVGALTTTGKNPTVVGRGIQPAAGALTLTGNRPSQRRITPGTSNLGLFANKPRVKTANDAATGLIYFNYPALNNGAPLKGATSVTPPDSAPISIPGAGGNVSARYFKALVLDSLGASGRRDPLVRSFYDPVGQDAHFERSAISSTEGNPTPPSQAQGAPGFYRSYVPVQAGNWTVSIDVKVGDLDGDHETVDLAVFAPFPRLTVRANADVGLLADVVADAASQFGWQTLTCAFAVAATGVVEVWREKRSVGMDDVVYWDNLVATRV